MRTDLGGLNTAGGFYCHKAKVAVQAVVSAAVATSVPMQAQATAVPVQAGGMVGPK